MRSVIYKPIDKESSPEFVLLNDRSPEMSTSFSPLCVRHLLLSLFSCEKTESNEVDTVRIDITSTKHIFFFTPSIGSPQISKVIEDISMAERQHVTDYLENLR
jgi:hypothetical protein